MEFRLHWFRNALGVVLGLVVGLIAMSPVALKALAMMPVLSILTPSQDQEVSGTVAFYALADSEGIASLQFKVDGEDLGSAITAGSCRAAWNSTEAVDGLHTLQAIGRDQFNNPIASLPVTVRVNNFVAAPPPPVANIVTILSPSPNAVVKGSVQVSVSAPALTASVTVELKNAGGATVSSWVATAPGGSTTTFQATATTGGLPTATYSFVATATMSGAAPIVSAPMPVLVDNTAPAPPAPPATNSVTILSPSPNAVIAGIVPVSVAVPSQTASVTLELKDVWGVTLTSWVVPVSPGASAATVQVNATIGALANANYSFVATANRNGAAPVVSGPVPVRVENPTAVPPPPATPAPTPAPAPQPPPPPVTAPPAPAPPTPPTTTPPADSVAILSPSANSVVQGIVPVFVAIPAQTLAVVVELKTTGGTSVVYVTNQLAPVASTTTVQVNATLDGVASGDYSFVASAMRGGAAPLTSEPVTVHVQNMTPASPTPQPSAGRVPSRIMSPTAAPAYASPSLATGAARPRPQAQTATAERATVRSSTATSSSSSSARAGFKSTVGSGGNAQKSTAPAVAKSTGLPAGTMVTIGLGPCDGKDPYAKHPTLKGECVSGTWFPRVRKAEPRR